ncbi:MAG: spinster family MFS transporter [Candidatus Binatia bacterium]
MKVRTQPSPTSPASVMTETVSPQYRRYALILLLAVFTSSHVDRQILAILLEPIKHELVLSDTQLGFLSGIAFAIFYATLGIPIAMWADRSNRRNIITLALATWSGMTVVCGMAANFCQLALARIGVGVGEAGSTPPSHSIIADMYPPTERATAMGTFSLGVNFGLLIGFLVGGWINQWYGWRAAFWVVGAPGLVLALLVRYTLREPPRGYAEGLQATTHEAPSFRAVVSSMWSTPALRHVAAGATLASFVGYGVVLWLPAFLVRSHGLQSGVIGTVLAVGFGVVGGIGTYLGGRLADRLGRRDIRWNVWVVGVALLLALPFTLLFYLVQATSLAFAVGAVPALLGGMYLGPSFALNQGLVSVRMRSVASAILLFIVNIIGLGLGPQTVGILSDAFSARYGSESLRYALLTLAGVNVWTAFHYFMAGRTLQADLAKAQRL